uniref:dATP/dGTP diphosphohydrolase MazZ domain-containing protein n=1 Tax=Dinoroseobacter phage vB_DshS_R26L TaxID=3161158 RepID=A0AAU7VGQ3_9CAUD
MSDHLQFLARQVTFGRLAFGPGERRKGVVDHIEQELEEIAACDTAEARAEEWVDVVLLSQDGLLRAVREALRKQFEPFAHEAIAHKGDRIIARFGEPTADYVAECALKMITAKRDKNELREWDDWRVVGEDVAVNHKEGSHD